MKLFSKRLPGILLVGIMVFTLFPAGLLSVSAKTRSIYTYSVLNGEATITDCDEKASGSITIPSKLGGYPVTSIGRMAFVNCTGLTRVIIPESVKSIMYSAFSGCSGLATINIPDSITSIEYNAFFKCYGLSSINIGRAALIINSNTFNKTAWYLNQPDGIIYLGNVAYQYKGKMPAHTSIVLKPGTAAITNFAFSNCTGLTSINIPSSVISIGVWAFEGCTGLTGITIPDSVTSIGDCAFYGCTSMRSISIGSGVKAIHGSVFSGCEKLRTFKVNELNTNYSSQDGILYNKAKTDLLTCLINKPVYVLPNTVKIIEENAFNGCTALKAINVDKGNAAYSSLDGVLYNKPITSLLKCPEAKPGCVNIPNSVKNISESAFDGCTKLKSINVNSSNPNFSSEKGILLNKAGTEVIQIPGGKTHCDIPNSVTDLKETAISYNSRLTKITIGSGVKAIDDYTFSWCNNLKNILVDKQNTQYASQNGLLLNKSKTELIICPEGKFVCNIPNSVTDLKETAISYNSRLTRITIGSGVKNIDNHYTFSSCKKLKTILVDKQNIHYASQNGLLLDKSKSTLLFCPYGKTACVIPNGVTDISSSALWRHNYESGFKSPNTALLKLVIPASLTKIENSAFNCCSSLKSIEVDKSNTTFSSIDGVLFNKEKTMLIHFPSGNKIKKYTVPDSMTKISTDAFNEWCTSFTAFIVKSSNTAYSAQDGVLFNKDKTVLIRYPSSNTRKAYTIPDGVKKINRLSFDNCEFLEQIIIADSVETIETCAFNSCHSIKSIIIPKGVKHIGEFAFDSDYHYNQGGWDPIAFNFVIFCYPNTEGERYAKIMAGYGIGPCVIRT